MKTEFSTLDIGKALKIPRERLREWIDRGFVLPSVSASGQGTKAIFTLRDVYSIALFECLIDYGFNRATASGLMKNFMNKLKGEPQGHETAFILFEESVISGKKCTSVITLTYDDWVIGLKSGTYWLDGSPPIATSLAPGKYRMMISPTGLGWQTMHIVNFKELRENVNQVMAKV
jgi:hypothetical protein